MQYGSQSIHLKCISKAGGS